MISLISPRRPHLILLLMVLCLSGPLGAATEEAPEDLFFAEIPTVVTPSRLPQKPWHAPSSVTVITAEQIESWGARSLAEVLRRVPGMDLFQYGLAHTMAPRGMANTQRITNVLYLIDGVPAHDPILSTFDIGIDFPLELVKQIEIVRGPGSSLYGANALSGVVNVITKRARDLPGTDVKNRFGPDMTVDASVVRGQPSLGTSWLAGFRLHRTEGREANMVNGNDWLRDRDFFFNGSRGKGDVFLLYSDIEQGRPLAEYDADPTDWVSNQDLYMRSSYRFYERESGMLQLQLYANHKDGDYPGGCVDGVPPGLCTRPDRVGFDTIREGANLQWTHAPDKRRTIVAGLEFSNKEADWLDIGGEQSSQERSIYFQEDRELRGRWKLTVGARMDEDSIFGSFLSPRLSALKNLNDRSHLRCSVSRAFRSPNFSEQYIEADIDWYPIPGHPNGNDGVPIRVFGDETLEPEEILSYELAFGRRVGSQFRFEISLFQNKSRNRIAVDELNPFYIGSTYAPFPDAIGVQVINQGRLMTRGGELVLEGRRGLLRWWANYAYQRAFDRDTEAPLDLAPRHKFNLTLDRQLRRNWSVVLHSRTISERLDGTGSHLLGGFTIFDARIERRFASGSRLSLTAYNVGDKSYYETWGFPMPPRTVSIELRTRF